MMANRRFHFCLLFLLMAGRLLAVALGDSREAVVQEKGSPNIEVQGNGRTVLTFTDRSSVVLEDGKVVKINPAREESAEPAQPPPATSKASRGAEVIRILLAIGVLLIVGRWLYLMLFSSSGDFSRKLDTTMFPTWTYLRTGDNERVRESEFAIYIWLGLTAGAGLFVYVWMGGDPTSLFEWLRK